MNETIQYYNQNAAPFFNSTISADMTGLRNKFLSYIPPQAAILDAGCGSGRDSKVFIEKGYTVEAVDASEKLCELAGDYIGQPVRNITFKQMDYINQFDGIWACASILHIAKSELPDILKKLHRALKENGILYASFKYGDTERLDNGRAFSDFTEISAAKLFQGADYQVLECFTTFDVRPDREGECWTNIFARRR